ncbi:MAG: protease pro-enzyme activation domain-containing protein, partial [Pseudomonadota bacterium]|nr:protease pro-enzyme activation domain-containing protein [Pseudomonadota bacterium]
MFLPLRNTSGLAALLTAQQRKGSPSYHKWLTPAQFGAQFGPAPAAMSQVASALEAAGFQVTAAHTRSLHVAGTAAQVGAAFGTTFKTVQSADGSRDIVAASKLTLPASIAQAGVVIPAFAAIPNHRTFSQKVNLPTDRHSVVGPY